MHISCRGVHCITFSLFFSVPSSTAPHSASEALSVADGVVEGGGGHQQVERVLDQIVGEHREEAPAAEDVLRLEEAAILELLRDVLEVLALRDLAEQDLRRLPRAWECRIRQPPYSEHAGAGGSGES